VVFTPIRVTSMRLSLSFGAAIGTI
jgi:hypothetical protein